MTISYSRILSRNVIASTARYFITFAIAFFLTPIVIRALGTEGYGIWVLVYSFVGYAGILELGIMPATVKLISQYASDEDCEKRNAVANTAIIFYTILGVMTCYLFWTIFVDIIVYLARGAIDRQELTLFSRLVGMEAFVTFASFPLMGIVYGMQQYQKQSLRDVVIGMANLFGCLAVLHMGWGLLGLALVKLGLSLLSLLVLVTLCRNEFRKIEFGLRYVRRSAFKELFGIGSSLFIMQALAKINYYAIPALITTLRSAAMTAYFNVAQTLTGRLNEFLWSISAPFMPVFSEINAGGQEKTNQAKIFSLYTNGSRLLIAASMPIYVGLFFLGPDFLSVWVMPVYGKNAGMALQILVLEMFVIGLQPLIERMVVGLGILKGYINIVAIGNALGLALMTGLIMLFGIKGAACACLIKSVGIQIGLFRYLKRQLGIIPVQYLNQCFVPVIPALLLQSVCLLIACRFVSLTGYLPILSIACLSVPPYFACAYYFLPRDQRALVVSMIKRLKITSA